MKRITKEYLHDLFTYCDGKLYWKVARSHRVSIGKEAGTPHNAGYLSIRIDGVLHLAHRLIYLMHCGEIPPYLDHINGNRLDNRIENLRGCSHTQNNRNSVLRLDSTSGHKNVKWHKQAKKWVVRLNTGNVNKHIGLFEDLELAALVAMMAREKYHGKFANHGE